MRADVKEMRGEVEGKWDNKLWNYRKRLVSFCWGILIYNDCVKMDFCIFPKTPKI